MTFLPKQNPTLTLMVISSTSFTTLSCSEFLSLLGKYIFLYICQLAGICYFDLLQQYQKQSIRQQGRDVYLIENKKILLTTNQVKKVSIRDQFSTVLFFLSEIYHFPDLKNKQTNKKLLKLFLCPFAMHHGQIHSLVGNIGGKWPVGLGDLTGLLRP